MILKYDLKSGDMIFSDNHWVVHGRTPFEDYDDQNKKRLKNFALVNIFWLHFILA